MFLILITVLSEDHIEDYKLVLQISSTSLGSSLADLLIKRFAPLAYLVIGLRIADDTVGVLLASGDFRGQYYYDGQSFLRNDLLCYGLSGVKINTCSCSNVFGGINCVSTSDDEENFAIILLAHRDCFTDVLNLLIGLRFALLKDSYSLFTELVHDYVIEPGTLDAASSVGEQALISITGNALA